MNSRERVLRLLRGEEIDRVPVMPITMMFAGDLAGVPYLDYVSDSEVLVEAQLRTAERFQLDQVSCISDPAREAADLGAAVEFFPDQPPAFLEDRALLKDKSLLARLPVPEPRNGPRMADRIRAAERFRERLGGSRIIEGWIEGPCAQGANLRGINTLMTDFYDDPEFVMELFDFVVKLELRFAEAQIEAGVDIMGIGDAASSLVGPRIYERFVWPFQKRIVDGLHRLGVAVRLHICGDTRLILGGIGRLGCEIVDLDWMVPVAMARETMGERQILLGNLDPVKVLLKGTASIVKDGLAACHREAGRNYIAGAGCEVPRGTPWANVEAFSQYSAGTSAA